MKHELRSERHDLRARDADQLGDDANASVCAATPHWRDRLGEPMFSASTLWLPDPAEDPRSLTQPSRRVPMHRRAFVALALLLSLSACEGSTDPIPTVTGVWSGISDGITVSVTLAQTNSSVSGSGTLSGISVLAIAVSGTFVNPNLSLTITAGGFEDVNFTGTLSGNSVTGTLNGSGFTNESITLTRD